MTKNLSPGGLLFASEAPVSVGDELDMTVALSGIDRVSMSGVVRRLGLAADWNVNDGSYGLTARRRQTEVAVAFTRITSLDQDRIVRLILLTEHRRREAMRSQQVLAD